MKDQEDQMNLPIKTSKSLNLLHKAGNTYQFVWKKNCILILIDVTKKGSSFRKSSIIMVQKEAQSFFQLPQPCILAIQIIFIVKKRLFCFFLLLQQSKVFFLPLS